MPFLAQMSFEEKNATWPPVVGDAPDIDFSDIDPHAPTNHLPGTLEKLRVLRARLAASAPLFLPGDCRDTEDRTGLGYLANTPVHDLLAGTMPRMEAGETRGFDSPAGSFDDIAIDDIDD